MGSVDGRGIVKRAYAALVVGAIIGVACWLLEPVQPRSVIATLLLTTAFFITIWAHD